VRTAKVTRSSVPLRVRAVGRLASKRASTLAFKNGGTVRSLFVDVGATVKRGQLLGAVDATEIGAQVAQAEAAVDKAERDYDRLSKLAVGAIITQADLDGATTARDVARASLASARYNRAAATLVAPEDGRIERRLAEPGEQVAPGAPIYAFSGAKSGIVARVGVTDRDVVVVHVGDRAQVSVDAFGGRTWSGAVREIATAASVPSGTYQIEVSVDGADASLLQGMTVKVDITCAPSAPLALVPLAALVDAHGDRGAVYTLDGDLARRREVTIARLIDDRVAIGSGLESVGDVVAEGAQYLAPGMRARIVEP
jgi:RND family efflux transporter MFP subunit